MPARNQSAHILILGTIAILFPVAAFALSQFDNFTLRITPGMPGPNQSAKAEVVSYSTDLDSANIIWRINNKIVSSGIGVKTLNFTTGPIGSSVAIQADVTAADGSVLSQSSTVAISNVDLLWHADSYTPPYYFGKGLLATKSAVTITAIPHLYKNGQRLSPDSLIYEWRLDGWNMTEKSGFNKQALTFVTDGLNVHREHLIEATISDRGRTIETTKSLTLAPSSVETGIIYQNNPLLGPLFNKAITAITVAPGTEKQFIAVPYNFALAGLESPDYLWSANGQPETEAPLKKYLFNFRSLSDASGNINIGLQIANKLHPTQSASSQINISVQ